MCRGMGYRVISFSWWIDICLFMDTRREDEMKIGEPAFPSATFDKEGIAKEGMSLRDYFAAKAMAVIMTAVGGIV